MNYRVEVNTAGDPPDSWNGNGLVFATKAAAESYALDLACRWTAVRDWRVVETDKPANRD